MTVNVPDRFKAANAFWIGLAKIGLTPAAVRVGFEKIEKLCQPFALGLRVGLLVHDGIVPTSEPTDKSLQIRGQVQNIGNTQKGNKEPITSGPLWRAKSTPLTIMHHRCIIHI